jgi:hypothetical protein
MHYASSATEERNGVHRVVALTTQQAAELTRRNRTTIWRACKDGRVSSTKGDTGEYLIEVAELERAFGRLHSPQQTNQVHVDAVQPDATVDETMVLHREVDLLREQVRMLTADKEDLRSERDRLISMLEKQAEQVRLLTDERQLREHQSPSLWAWLWRRTS